MDIVKTIQISHSKKRKNGVYYTAKNPFILFQFKEWARDASIKKTRVLEPFAGSNNIIKMLKKIRMCNKFCSFDIDPQDKYVKKKDTLDDFPRGYDICISNPPWVGKYAAKRRNIKYPNIPYDDLYKQCLKLALDNCSFVGFIIPATFLQSNLFRERLQSVTFLNDVMFYDTENPVCLALFIDKSAKTKIYYNDKFVGFLKTLEKYIPKVKVSNTIQFNVKNGDLGLIGIDNTKKATIRFCKGSEIKQEIKSSSRSITRINMKLDQKEIDELNQIFNEFRTKTHDVFLTPFKGLRADGKYRRRLDYCLARKFLSLYN